MSRFSDMYDDDYAAMLRTMMNRDPDLIKDTIAKAGHAFEEHTGKTDDEMILRSVKEKKDVTQFLDDRPPHTRDFSRE